jgi:hypothetical protein
MVTMIDLQVLILRQKQKYNIDLAMFSDIVNLSSAEPLTGEEMPYMDGERETDAVVISDNKPGQCHLSSH